MVGVKIMDWSEKDRKGISRKEKLFLRQRIMEIIRSYFREHDFFEAEIPLLVSGTTPDPGIQSFEVQDKYLTTSTEYHIKRMIAGGFDRVFTVTKNFRKYEFDALHNPEFTMLEWARAQGTLEAIEQDLITLIGLIGKTLFPEKEFLDYQGFKIPLTQERWQEMTFQELFYTQYGITIPEDYEPEEIPGLVQKAGLPADPLFSQEPSLLVSDLLDKGIKHIGFEAPVLLKKWPSSMTSSADCETLEAKWTKRTEVIIGGIEIADGFPFLCSYALQQRFFEEAAIRRRTAQLPPVQYDQKYLKMLKTGLCPGAGMALGIDRLCMLFTNSLDIREALCFAWDEL